MLLWMGDASVHELYTAACGLYFIWLVCRVGSVLLSWVPLGWKGVAGKVFEWVLLVSTLRNVQCQTFNKGYYFRTVDQKQKMGVNFSPAFLPLRFPAFCTKHIFLTSGTLHTFSALCISYTFLAVGTTSVAPFFCFPALGDNNTFSRAWQLRLFPRWFTVTLFPRWSALNADWQLYFSRAWWQLHFFLRWLTFLRAG